MCSLAKFDAFGVVVVAFEVIADAFGMIASLRSNA
jgi:hypothetical protein